jgi:hypothetical protein
MHRLLTLLVFSLLAGLTACAKDLSLAVSTQSIATVYNLDNKAERTLVPGSPARGQLVQWVATNHNGWRPYLATPPALGVIVRTSELDLQFMGSTVLAHTRDGVFSKSVEPRAYSFLLQ